MPDTIRPVLVSKFMPPPYAGVEAHVDTLARALAPHCAPTVVTGELPGRDRSQDGALPYRLLTSRSWFKLSSVFVTPGVLPRIRRELASGRANLLHHHAPNPWGELASLAVDAPVVMTWHSDIVRQQTLLKFYGPIQRRALERADRILVFTPKHYESSTQLKRPGLERKMAVVPIGIDFAGLDVIASDPQFLHELQAWTRGRPLILTVGRHVYYKGYEHLLRAMALMRTEAVLALVGTGQLTDTLRRLAEELGLAERVRFLGSLSTPRMVTAMRACDLFTLPSIAPAEAFGIASAEAMSMGKPTVVCRLGNGVDFLNQAGTTSLAVPPRDESALAQALETLAADAALRRRMGAAAAEWVRGQFSIEAMVQGTLRVYRELL
ncbi:MAG TPA: glycosyltransferase [Ramlibacter sp.]|nr:glycosyltransferase [Ramlibacter sp.]